MRAVRWLRFNNYQGGSLVKQSHSDDRLLNVAARWLTFLFLIQGVQGVLGSCKYPDGDRLYLMAAPCLSRQMVGYYL
jgi:hypothetical protein